MTGKEKDLLNAMTKKILVRDLRLPGDEGAL